MSSLEYSDVYWKFAGQCTQCGHCTEACSSLTKAQMTLGDIAKAMLAADRDSSDAQTTAAKIVADEKLVQAVRGCFFCTSCKNTCFAHNDVCELIYHARVDFQQLGLIPRDTWTSVQVDQEWDIFTAYRAIYGIGFDDIKRHLACESHEAQSDCEIAFFPGCAMAAYAPELTREVFATVQELGGKATMIDHCCGSPLKSAGFYDRAEALLDRIADELDFSGAKRVVCVCPGCANAVRTTLERRGIQIETISLSAFLVEHGFKPKRELPQGELCLAKSCQDRDGSYLQETCAALGIDSEMPSIFHGCCGAGGAVSAFQPQRQAEQASSKLDFAADGSTVVSMCPTCTYTYAFRLMEEERNLANKHYTELLFENGFDWDKVFGQLGGMYTGEYASWLAYIFA